MAGWLNGYVQWDLETPINFYQLSIKILRYSQQNTLFPLLHMLLCCCCSKHGVSGFKKTGPSSLFLYQLLFKFYRATY